VVPVTPVNFPAEQTEQKEAPVSENRPTAHSSHDDWPAVEAKVPLEQSPQEVDFSTEKLPGEQVEQIVAESISEYWPPGQFVQDTAASSEKVPAKHWSQSPCSS
jgi:hypothetical protein